MLRSNLVLVIYAAILEHDAFELAKELWNEKHGIKHLTMLDLGTLENQRKSLKFYG